MKTLRERNNYCIAITKGLFDYFHLNGNSRVIYNPVLNADDCVFNENKEPYFLFAGTLAPSKGIKDLIFAYSEFAKFNDSHYLYVAGDTGDIRFKNHLLKIIEKTI